MASAASPLLSHKPVPAEKTPVALAAGGPRPVFVTNVSSLESGVGGHRFRSILSAAVSGSLARKKVLAGSSVYDVEPDFVCATYSCAGVG